MMMIMTMMMMMRCTGADDDDDHDDDDDDEMHRGGTGAVFAPAADGLTAIHRRHRLYRRRPAVELRTTNRGDVSSHGDQLVVCLFVCFCFKQTSCGKRSHYQWR